MKDFLEGVRSVSAAARTFNVSRATIRAVRDWTCTTRTGETKLTEDRPITVGDAPTDRNHEFLFIEGDRIVGRVYPMALRGRLWRALGGSMMATIGSSSLRWLASLGCWSGHTWRRMRLVWVGR